ncbi:MAG: AlpA family phage regulatory protein [Dinoroseobacter sp.]|nr:AlpA family phage regulatory protein [Dinoroseobacter sp.]
MNQADHFLSDVDLAKRYKINRATVWRWLNQKPDFPRPVALSDRVRRWRQSEIIKWEQEREKQSAVA